MADYTSSSQGGGYSFEHDAGLAPQVAAKPLTKFANFAGAALSITLIVGIGVWGYKLLVRDVTGIPVVRAAQGDMRVRPENPGGQLADNQGLSVNAVASEGTANQFAEQLILAPKPLDLEEEDQPIPVAMVAPAQQAPTQSSPAADVAEALKNGDVDDLVASLTDGVEPLEDEEDGTALPEPMNASATMDVDPLEMAVSNAVAVAMGEEPGVRSKVRELRLDDVENPLPGHPRERVLAIERYPDKARVSSGDRLARVRGDFGPPGHADPELRGAERGAAAPATCVPIAVPPRACMRSVTFATCPALWARALRHTVGAVPACFVLFFPYTS